MDAMKLKTDDLTVLLHLQPPVARAYTLTDDILGHGHGSGISREDLGWSLHRQLRRLEQALDNAAQVVDPPADGDRKFNHEHRDRPDSSEDVIVTADDVTELYALRDLTEWLAHHAREVLQKYGPTLSNVDRQYVYDLSVESFQTFLLLREMVHQPKHQAAIA